MEKIIKKLAEIDKRYKVTILAACVIGFVTHMFMFMNLLPGNDETMFYFRLGGTCSFGRWGLHLLGMKLPFLDVSLNTNFGMPWVKGSVSVILLALSACCVVKIFEIKNKVLCILVGGVLVTYPAVAATFSYMFTSSCYFFGMLLAGVAVIVTKNALDRKKTWQKCVGFVISAILLMLSLSVYQAYVTFAIGLYVADLILQCIKSEKNWKVILGECFIYLGIILLGLAFYYLSIQIMLAFFWPTLASYRGINELYNSGVSGFISVMLVGMEQAYKTFFSTPFIWHETLLFRKMLRTLLLAASIINIFVSVAEKKLYKDLKCILLLLLLLLFPLASCSIFMMGSSAVSTLSLYGTVVQLLFYIALLEKDNAGKKSGFCKIYKISSEIVMFSIVILCYQYYLVSNEAYNRQYFTYEQTYGYMNRVAYTIENTEGYTPETPVMLLGKVEKAVTMPQFERLNYIAGIFGESDLVNGYSREEFIRRYCGLPIVIADDAVRDEIKKSDEYKQMNVYPAEGSVKIVEECLVVKFSQE